MIANTYARDSKVTNRNKLYDPYIKAIRWALDRIGDEGVVAFITNNRFLDGVAFDGMRKHLVEDCDAIYILDLGGNARKGLKVSNANVFGIRVGVSINFFIKKGPAKIGLPNLYYHQTDELWNKQRKFDFLNKRGHIGNITWESIQPDARHTWLTKGLHTEFDTFIPMGTKKARSSKNAPVNVIFKTYSIGINTSRDAWVYNFNRSTLTENISRMIQTYNAEVARWEQRTDRETNLDDFVVSDDDKD